LKAGIVVIDPGHGGHDTGTTSKSGLQEKDLALDLALRLKSLLKERMGVEAVLTRSKDTFVSLEERTHIANKHKADLFISLHANHSSSSRVSGVETYVLNFARSVYERELAARENAAAHYRIADLEDLIRAIAHEEKLAESVEFARFVQKSLQAEMTRQNPSSRSRGVKQAPFVVLAGSAMPSILTEVAFLSNPRDSAALSKEKARAATAEALYKGIFGYVQSLSQEASLRRQPSR
jgi:N-acetylmuramoyl-L-alanine amidase